MYQGSNRPTTPSASAPSHIRSSHRAMVTVKGCRWTSEYVLANWPAEISHSRYEGRDIEPTEPVPERHLRDTGIGTAEESWLVGPSRCCQAGGWIYWGRKFVSTTAQFGKSAEATGHLAKRRRDVNATRAKVCAG